MLPIFWLPQGALWYVLYASEDITYHHARKMLFIKYIGGINAAFYLVGKG